MNNFEKRLNEVLLEVDEQEQEQEQRAQLQAMHARRLEATKFDYKEYWRAAQKVRDVMAREGYYNYSHKIITALETFYEELKQMNPNAVQDPEFIQMYQKATETKQKRCHLCKGQKETTNDFGEVGPCSYCKGKGEYTVGPSSGYEIGQFLDAFLPENTEDNPMWTTEPARGGWTFQTDSKGKIVK